VLLFGNVLATRIGMLARYSVPSPVVGGIAFAVAVATFTRATGRHLSLQDSARSDLLLLFFACLGLTADLRQFAHGGARLLRFLMALIPFLFAQDALGVAVARLLGFHPFLGLVAGARSVQRSPRNNACHCYAGHSNERVTACSRLRSLCQRSRVRCTLDPTVAKTSLGSTSSDRGIHSLTPSRSRHYRFHPPRPTIRRITDDRSAE
jgi:hypothetical protein